MRVGAAVQLHRKNNWDRIVEGAAVQIKLHGCTSVDADEIRARPAGLVVDLQLIRAGRWNSDIRKGHRIRSASHRCCRLSPSPDE